jgi:hypothetical protein
LATDGIGHDQPDRLGGPGLGVRRASNQQRQHAGRLQGALKQFENRLGNPHDVSFFMV